MRRTALAAPILGAVLLASGGGAGAQQPPAAAAAPAAAQAPSAGGALEPRGYDYEAAGRRDPFVSLIRRGSESPGTVVPAGATGLAALTTDEVSLRGTIAGREGWVALLQGADGRTYIVRAGEALADGTIRTIADGVLVIAQPVNDPLSLEREREVRKTLRGTDERN